MSTEIAQRKAWNRHMIPLVKRRGLVSTLARRWIELVIRENERMINEWEYAEMEH